MPRIKRDRCSVCSAPMYPTPDAAAVRVCHGCRRAGLAPRKSRPLRRCAECGRGFRVYGEQETCSRSCGQRRAARNRIRGRAVPTEWTRKTRRRWRESAPPGLSVRQLRELRDRYVMSGASCVYCGAPALTVDHVVPVSRGGTNFEGNLVPACKACNSSKCDLLLVEWRFGRPHGGTVIERPWMVLVRVPRRKREPKPKVNPHGFSMLCPCCLTRFVPTSRRTTCGDVVCSREYHARVLRDRYRASHDLEPKGLDYPTKTWIRKRVVVYAAAV